MEKIYAELILKGLKTIDDVPDRPLIVKGKKAMDEVHAKLREEVADLLKALEVAA